MLPLSFQPAMHLTEHLQDVAGMMRSYLNTAVKRLETVGAKMMCFILTRQLVQVSEDDYADISFNLDYAVTNMSELFCLYLSQSTFYPKLKNVGLRR